MGMGGGCKDYQRTGLGENPDTWTAYHCLEQDHSSYHGRNGGFNLEKAINHFGELAVASQRREGLLPGWTILRVEGEILYIHEDDTPEKPRRQRERPIDLKSELVSLGQLLKECATAYLVMKPTLPVALHWLQAAEAAAGARPPRFQAPNAMAALERARQRARQMLQKAQKAPRSMSASRARNGSGEDNMWLDA